MAHLVLIRYTSTPVACAIVPCDGCNVCVPGCALDVRANVIEINPRYSDISNYVYLLMCRNEAIVGVNDVERRALEAIPATIIMGVDRAFLHVFRVFCIDWLDCARLHRGV